MTLAQQLKNKKIIISFLAISTIIPFSVLFLLSFYSRWPWPDILPSHFSTRAWTSLFLENKNILSALLGSLLIATCTAVISAIISFPLARSLSHNNLKFRYLWEFLVFLPLFLPVYVPIMGLHIFFIKAQLQGSFAAVVLVHLFPTLPYMIRSLKLGYDTIGSHYSEVGETMGLSPAKIFYKITLPLLRPALITGSLFVFLGSMGQYLITLIVGGLHYPALPLVVVPFLRSDDPMVAAVSSLLLTLPGVAFLILVEVILRRAYSKRGISLT